MANEPISKPGRASGDKMFYQIKEISEMLGIKSHVLRYWETEFPQLRPDKGSTGQRLYRPKDLELVKRIKTLLYEEKFTIAGAKKKLAGELRHDKSQMDLNLNLRENHLLNTIHKVKRELESLLTILNQ